MNSSTTGPQRGRSIIVARGFHGTTVTHADEFLGDPPAPLYISRNRHDWLGDGFYVWQDAPERAWAWASDHASGRSDPRPAVVGARLEFDATTSMDLLDVGWHDDLTAAYVALNRVLDAKGEPRKTNSPSGNRQLDRAVINLAVDIIEATIPGLRIAVVRGAFQEGTRIYDGAELWTLSHVQIAVRDDRAIVDRWRER